MSVIRKMVTLLRGSAREIGESIVDANGTTIYAQEISDARHSLQQAKADLAGVMAKQMQAEREMRRLQAEIERYEGLAIEALDKAQEALAEEVAAKVAGLEQALAEQTRSHETFSSQVQRLKGLIQAADARLREHEREVEIARTTESVYRATQSISDNIAGGGSRLTSARESLERIRRRHEDLADRMQAGEQLAQEFGDAALHKKLADAGIGPDAERQQRVMARIRARRSAEPGGGGNGNGSGGSGA